MKKCPFCAEEIQDEAIKCKHCGEFLDGRKQAKEEGPWYLSTKFMVMTFLFAGPLVLPLVWINPKFNNTKKLVITIIILIVSYALWKMMQSSMNTIGEYNDLLMGSVP